ncbi:MAG TPA: hypothetical protein VFD01_14290, partial [Candidatus Dormibacteraeota bacterium]|nr:hypothetical protein [Candidatus Dormibacteraeota bacterium]
MDLRVFVRSGSEKAERTESIHEAVRRLRRMRRLLIAGASAVALMASGPAPALAAAQAGTGRATTGGVGADALGHLSNHPSLPGLALLGPVISPSAAPDAERMGVAGAGGDAAQVVGWVGTSGERDLVEQTSTVPTQPESDRSSNPRAGSAAGDSGETGRADGASGSDHPAHSDRSGASGSEELAVSGPVIPWRQDSGGVRQSNLAVQSTEVGKKSAVGTLAPIQVAPGINVNVGASAPASDASTPGADSGGVRQSNLAVQSTEVGKKSAVGTLAPVQVAPGINVNGASLPASGASTPGADSGGVRQSNLAVQSTEVGKKSAVGTLAPVQVAP